ncbi:MAG: hypothetical protein ACK5LP_04835 [Campylobacteraceae bacterium]
MIKLNIANLNNVLDNHYEKIISLVRLEAITKINERQYVKDNLERIIKAEKEDFNTIADEVSSFNKKELSLAFVGSKKKDKTKKGSSNGYEKFAKKSSKIYNAYDLAKKLNIHVCPYCNRNYIHTIKSIYDKSARPQFDHFICKKEHPIFALSFFNLIPCCSVCNSSIKGQSKFSFETHIHPYFDDFNKIKKFTTSKPPLMIYNIEEFEIEFKNGVAKDSDRADNFIKDFALEALYNCHKDKVLELVDFSRAYNENSLENLVKEFAKSTKIFKNTNDIKRLLLCHHIEDINIDKRPLNKLIKDISEELGLIP